MKLTSSIKKLFAFAFTALVLFTISVRETHYLFAAHHVIQEHCDNHLHGQEESSHCSVCKLDISFFTDNFSHPAPAGQQFSANVFSPAYQSVTLHPEISSNSLRGPPSLA